MPNSCAFVFSNSMPSYWSFYYRKLWRLKVVILVVNDWIRRLCRSPIKIMRIPVSCGSEEIQEDPDFMAEMQKNGKTQKKCPIDHGIPLISPCIWYGNGRLIVPGFGGSANPSKRRNYVPKSRRTRENVSRFLSFCVKRTLTVAMDKKDDPELFTDVQESVKAGNIELVGDRMSKPTE